METVIGCATREWRLFGSFLRYEACRSCLFTVEFEVQLPPISSSFKKDAAAELPLVVVVVQVSVEPRSMKAKFLVPRTAGRDFFYPTARGGGGSPSRDFIEVGLANVSVVPMESRTGCSELGQGTTYFNKRCQFWSNVARHHSNIHVQLYISSH